MGISEAELKRLIGDNLIDLEKISSLSDDGRNLLTRVPQKIRAHLGLIKGNKLRWIVNKDGDIKIEVIKLDGSPQ